jgi:hypothetical protein
MCSLPVRLGSAPPVVRVGVERNGFMLNMPGGIGGPTGGLTSIVVGGDLTPKGNSGIGPALFALFSTDICLLLFFDRLGGFRLRPGFVAHEVFPTRGELRSDVLRESLIIIISNYDKPQPEYPEDRSKALGADSP